MTRHFILFILLIHISTLSIAQKLGDYYVPISIDNSQEGRLKFLSDSIAEISSISRHMSPSIKAVYKYKSTDTSIQMLLESITKSNKHFTEIYAQSLTPIAKISLTKIDKGFIDHNNSLIYVRQKDFGKYPDIIYLIDGKKFIQDTGEQDGYGLVKKRPKTNKALEKKLKKFTKDNCTIEFVKGLNAYNRFGIKYVFGTIVITSKE